MTGYYLERPPEINPTAEEQLNEARRRFSQVFGGPDGQWVWHRILTNLRFFEYAQNDEDRVLQNAAKALLYLKGDWSEDQSDVVLRRLASRP